MAEVAVVQSGIVQGSFGPDLSKCIEASWGAKVLKHDGSKISHWPSVIQRLFGIGLERAGKYKKQMFVGMIAN